MSTGGRLKELRARIDRLDEEIQARISERAGFARDIAILKTKDGNGSLYRPERESEILRRVVARNTGPLSAAEMARLFREIISACLAIESPMRVAYLGPPGTFTQAATLKHFGHSVEAVPLTSIGDVFREVEAGRTGFGVVPIENSTEGVINHTLDLFVDSPLRICGEVEVRIHHQLLGKGTFTRGTRGAKRLLSHAQSLAQCRHWLDANLPGVERIAVASNAEAARRAAREKGILAIASETAAELYGLRVLAKNIEDEPDNTTRFLIIGKLDTEPSGTDKSSLMLSGHNRAGSLAALLAPLSRHAINMTRIESRPSRRALWEYVFFVDIEGHRCDEAVSKALADLEKGAAFFKFLGSYPRAVL